MNTTSATLVQAVIRRAGKGRRLRVFDGELTYILTAEESGGAYSAAIAMIPPDNGPPVHIHQNEDEILIVIEGQFSFFAGGTWSDAGPGTSVFLPRCQPHTFRNIGNTMGKLYVIANSPHLERFFELSEEHFYQEGGPDTERIARIGDEHGIHFV